MRIALGVLALVSLARVKSAWAHDLHASLGAGGGATSWEGDAGLHSSLKVGYRLRDWVSLDFLGRLGYGPVDERLLTYLSLGAELWGRLGSTRPHARFGLVHQHEEPIEVVGHDPFGALFGVGDGIRHRGGFHAGAGLDVPLYTVPAKAIVLRESRGIGNVLSRSAWADLVLRRNALLGVRLPPLKMMRALALAVTLG